MDKLCAHCGFNESKHGGATNPYRPFACPATGKEPKWPTTIRDEKKAGELLDKRLAQHWTKRKTSFRAMR